MRRKKGKSGLAGAGPSRIPGPEPLAPVSRLRILDPACGSGSFLLGAYQYLLDWHLNWYTRHDPDHWARQPNPPIYQVGARDSGLASPTPDGDPPTPGPESRAPGPEPRTPAHRLTVQEKKRILLNNIYGVDIDPQAVEVTKLSLLLKVLEGETAETIGSTLRLFHERALPDLDGNIKCGNSLIGPDFYEGRQMSMFDEDERLRINAFDYRAEFPEVFGTRDSGPGSRTPSPEPRPSSPEPRTPSPEPRTPPPASTPSSETRRTYGWRRSNRSRIISAPSTRAMRNVPICTPTSLSAVSVSCAAQACSE